MGAIYLVLGTSGDVASPTSIILLGLRARVMKGENGL